MQLLGIRGEPWAEQIDIPLFTQPMDSSALIADRDRSTAELSWIEEWNAEQSHRSIEIVCQSVSGRPIGVSLSRCIQA